MVCVFLIKVCKNIWQQDAMAYTRYQNGYQKKKMLMSNGRRVDQCTYQWHDYKNELELLIRVAEKYYYDKMFMENISWKLIRNVIKNKKCTRKNDEFHLNNCKIRGNNIVAKKLTHFMWIGGLHLPVRYCLASVILSIISEIVFILLFFSVLWTKKWLFLFWRIWKLKG